MKNLKKILTIAFLGVMLTSFGQNNTRIENISAISDKVIANLAVPKYGINDQETKKNLSLYGEYYKQKAYADALPFWRYVFFNAPKASKNTYIRGAKMYKELIKNAEGEVKEAFTDTLLAIYEARTKSYPSTSSETTKTFGWYSVRRKGNEAFVLDLFNKNYDYYVSNKKVPPASFLTYWVYMAIKADKIAEVIDSEKVLEIFEITTEIIAAQLPGEKGGEYKGAENAIMEDMNKYNYLNCNNIIPMAEKAFRANPDDENTIKKAYKSLKSVSCTNSPLFKEVATKMLAVQPSVALYSFLSSKERKEGNTSLGITYLNKAVDMSEIISEKIDLLLKIGGIYYSNGSKSSARKYANKVLALDANSGKAYILIGRTLAGACGEGIDKFATYWVAVDKWNRAKSLDSSVSSEAQKLINTYSSSFPVKKDLFMNGMTVGSSYTIPCLGITTTVRSSD